MRHSLGALLMTAVFLSVSAAELRKTVVPMHIKGASAFHVDVHIEGFGKRAFVVDTGASYTTIDEQTLTILRNKKRATYVQELEGVLADGTNLVVPVYRLASINIGGTCVLQDVEVAVFPSTKRTLLGLSALRRTAPFLFSIDPPLLELSNCNQTPA